MFTDSSKKDLTVEVNDAIDVIREFSEYMNEGMSVAKDYFGFASDDVIIEDMGRILVSERVAKVLDTIGVEVRDSRGSDRLGYVVYWMSVARWMVNHEFVLALKYYPCAYKPVSANTFFDCGNYLSAGMKFSVNDFKYMIASTSLVEKRLNAVSLSTGIPLTRDAVVVEDVFKISKDEFVKMVKDYEYDRYDMVMIEIA